MRQGNLCSSTTFYKVTRAERSWESIAGQKQLVFIVCFVKALVGRVVCGYRVAGQTVERKRTGAVDNTYDDCSRSRPVGKRAAPLRLGVVRVASRTLSTSRSDPLSFHGKQKKVRYCVPPVGSALNPIRPGNSRISLVLNLEQNTRAPFTLSKGCSRNVVKAGIPCLLWPQMSLFLTDTAVYVRTCFCSLCLYF